MRRKNYFIKKKFQLKFIASFIALLLVESLLIAVLFINVSTNTVTTGYANAILKVAKTSDFFLISFLLITLIAVVGMGLAGMVIFILLSHRIAGPLFRFEATLKDIEAGDLTKRINLRKSDQILELKEALNLLIDSLDRRMSKIKIGLLELRALLSKKDDPHSDAKIKSVIETLEHELESFRVSSDKK